MGVGALDPGHNRRNIAMIPAFEPTDQFLDDLRFLFTLLSTALGREHCPYCGDDLVNDYRCQAALERLCRRGWVREVRTARALYHEPTWLGQDRLKRALRGLR